MRTATEFSSDFCVYLYVRKFVQFVQKALVIQNMHLDPRSLFMAEDVVVARNQTSGDVVKTVFLLLLLLCYHPPPCPLILPTHQS